MNVKSTHYHLYLQYKKNVSFGLKGSFDANYADIGKLQVDNTNSLDLV